MVSILLPFCVRTTLLYVLGEKYLGLDSLFLAVLGVLNLAELGFSSAVTFMLYKAVAENDVPLMCALVRFLRDIYRKVGLFILVVGLCLMPFLPHLIKGGYPADINLYVLYVVYLFNSVISYWLFAYKQALIQAMQRMDLVNRAFICTSVVTKLCQIIALVAIKNYYAFVFLVPLGTIMNNLYVQHISEKYFADIIPKGKLDNSIKSNMMLQVYGLIINKVGDTARNVLGNIILSVTVGLSMVAVYANYNYIYASVYAISLIVTQAMQASVGNSVALDSKEKNYKDLVKFTFIFEWLCGWATVCMFCLYQPFMEVWTHGNVNLMLPDFEMGLFVAMFYVITINNTRNMYVDGTGIYWEMRRWYIVEAVADIILSFGLGVLFGTAGILLANIITLLLFNFVARTEVVFRAYFLRSTFKFYKQHLLYAFVTVVGLGLTSFICDMITCRGVQRIICNLLVCLVVPNLVYFVIYKNSALFKDAMSFIKGALCR